MKKKPTVKNLETTKKQLLESLNILDVVSADNKPEFLAHADKMHLEELLKGVELPLDRDDLFPETALCINEFMQKSNVLKGDLLAWDVDFLRDLKEKQKDVVSRGPYGFKQAGYPVRVRDVTLHVVLSGVYRDKAMSVADIKKLAKQVKMAEPALKTLLDTVPVLTETQVDQMLGMCIRLRNAIEHILAGYIHNVELTHQLTQSEKAHSLGMLSGGVAHHFNSLLSIILGYSSYILNREALSDEARDALHKVSEAAQRGRRLTEEVTALLGAGEEVEELCPMHEMLTGALSLLESQISAGVVVETDFKAKHDTVMALPGSIRQIIVNLLTNAVDGMPAGGVLSLSTANVKMPGSGKKKLEFIRLVVTDTSGTLPQGFKSAGKSKKAMKHGAMDRVGLKLSSVYGIVGRLEGTVVLSSEPGAKTSVEVLLPVTMDEKVKKKEQSQQKLGSKDIWVVDDDAIFRAMCRQLLSDENHKVKDFEGGRELQKQFQKVKRKPDLFIIDFSMPEFNGLQLCEWLRSQDETIPVVLVSGFSASQPDIRKALRLKRVSLLEKPFTSRDLSDAVTLALGESLIK